MGCYRSLRVVAGHARLLNSHKPLCRQYTMNFQGLANEKLGSTGNPPFIYGTAWKKENSTKLVTEAVSAGFRAIDTAAQPKHYREGLVGDALRECFEKGIVKREEIFIQTKFTPPHGQDETNMPYDHSAPLEQQIHTSVASSLENLRPEATLASITDSYIDSLVIHSPYETIQETVAAYRLLETYVPKRVRSLGISNIYNLEHLKALYDEVEIKPSFVQNRFYPQTKHDVELRKYCQEKGIVYQSFWTLTGNPKLLASEPVQSLSQLASVSKEVALYSLVISLGIAPLNGTTNAGRMKSDLDDLAKVRNWTNVYGEKWRKIVSQFKDAIGQKD
ncbi:putative aldo-keto reductase [Venturia nashicola]|nr:putative aldo-keto reductase [Venturia nashicola]